jgi:N-acetylglucosaminyldiphosphoundecaprenol N-acetyl-beta-D-mannosaminyltransferase
VLPRDLPLEPRARLADVVAGRARLVGARTRIGRRDLGLPPGVISPYEARERIGLRYGDPPIEEARHERGRSRMGDAAVVARWALSHAWTVRARALGDRPGSEPLHVLGVRIDPLDTGEVVDRVRGWLRAGRRAVVCFVHAHALNLAARDPLLRADLAAAELVVPDGLGLRVAAALLGRGLRANVNGTDLVPELLLHLGADGVPVALVGAAPGIAQRAADAWRARAAFDLVGAWDGFRTDPEYEAIARTIGSCAPALVLVGLGSPLQERFVRRFLAERRGLVALTVGGLFDFAAAAQPRAPLAWREMGAEWIWRLAHEPLRLGRRYLFGNPEFLIRVLAQRLSER